VEVNCTTDGITNFATVTFELKALENFSRDYIETRVENCRTDYKCISANVSSIYYTVLYCTASSLLVIRSPFCSKEYQIIFSLLEKTFLLYILCHFQFFSLVN